MPRRNALASTIPVSVSVVWCDEMVASMAKVNMEICCLQIWSNIISAPQTLENLTAMIELLQSSCMRVCRFLTSSELHFCGHLQISEDLKC